MYNVGPSLVLRGEAIEGVAFLPCLKANQVQKQEEAVQVGNSPFLLHHCGQTSDSCVHLLCPVRK